MPDYLFHGYADLSDAIYRQLEKMKTTIADLSPERINGATDDQLKEHYVAEYSIEPLTIYEDRAEAEHKEIKVDVSHDRFNRFIRDASGPVMVKGDEVTLHVPFTGETELFSYTPSTRNFNPPTGQVQKTSDLSGTIVMTLALASDANDHNKFNAWIKSQLQGIHEYVGWVNKDVNRFNTELTRNVLEAVTKRRQQLEKQGSLLKNLAIPIRPKNGAPSAEPIPLPKKVVKPLPPARKVEQEYGISEDNYDYILKIIRQESRSFESTPGTFAKLDEEELRDVVLAHLNGHFEGGASGERFRKKGKTDICIEHENRAAFVAECKLWKGQKAFKQAIDQLLGYLTWRDTRTALIVWNKDAKDFAKLQAGIEGYIQSHTKYSRMIDPGQPAEWRAEFRSMTDEGRMIVVHIFIVDLNVS